MWRNDTDTLTSRTAVDRGVLAVVGGTAARPVGDIRRLDRRLHVRRPVPRTELGGVAVHRIAFGVRGAPYPLATELGQHVFVLSAHGTIVVVSGGHELIVRDEKVALCRDGGSPLTLGPWAAGRPAEAVVMAFPSSAAPLAVAGPRHEVRDGAGAAVLLRGFLLQAVEEAPGLRVAEAARSGEAAIHLAAAVLERSGVEARNAPSAEQHELMTRIRGFIDRNVGDSELTPSRVATAHHISLRYLQRLFKTAGSTPSDWIRRRRLETCRRDLCTGELRSLSIREIGQRNGFPNASDFSRAFRAEFGVPPGRFRYEWFDRDVRG